MAAPVLTYDTETGNLNWGYDFDTPDHWSIQQSASEFGSYGEVDTVDGELTFWVVVADDVWYKVVAMNSSNEPVSLPSNAVFTPPP